MLKEKFERTKKFMKDHKTELALVTVSGALVVLGLNNKDLNTRLLKTEYDSETYRDIAKASLRRELSRNNCEIRTIEKCIDKLNNSNINVFDRIPKKMTRLNELKMYNKEILDSLDKLNK